MKVSAAGRQCIEREEGCRLVAYPDPATGGKPWTIGYGHTDGVLQGDRITAEQADALLETDLESVEQCLDSAVKVELSQAEFDALASLIFNIGTHAFEASTLLRLLNAGDKAEAAEHFLEWDRAAGAVYKPLLERRAREKARFLSAVADPPGDQPMPTASQVLDSPLLKFALAAINPILGAAPELAKLFLDRSTGATVPERNTAAAIKIVGIAQQALQDAGTPAPNAQAVAEAVTTSPEAKQAVRDALLARAWEFDLGDAGGGGIGGARQADTAAMLHEGPWWSPFRSPSFLVALLLMPLVYMIVGNVVGWWGKPMSDEVRSAIANGIPMLILGGLIGYYYGQTTSRNRTP